MSISYIHICILLYTLDNNAYCNAYGNCVYAFYNIICINKDVCRIRLPFRSLPPSCNLKGDPAGK